MQRKDFADELRALWKKSGVRQKDLADRLGLSCASVSQFMNGVSLPKLDQLHVMLTLMNVPAAEAGKLRFQLLIARSNGRDAADEDGALPEWPFKPEPDQAPEVSDPRWQDPSAKDIQFASPKPGEIQGVPLILLDDLDDYRPDVPLIQLARRKMRKAVFRDFGAFDEAVVLRAAGDRLGMPYCRMVQLAVTDAVAEGAAPLLLQQMTDGSRRVILADGKDASGWRNFLPAPADTKTGVFWQLAVLEITVIPNNRQDGPGTSEAEQ